MTLRTGIFMLILCLVPRKTTRLVVPMEALHNCVYSLSSALWSRSYCVMSVSGAPFEMLKRYIEGQAGADE
ncbi:transposase [Azospirillum sp. B21]|uniref:transposase n=1 Tax=Azospirillum sp. B21 TaxID=2607496 RepID=UPI001B3BF0DA|nr:transposase [Azospirillum sp. B21]